MNEFEMRLFLPQQLCLLKELQGLSSVLQFDRYHEFQDTLRLGSPKQATIIDGESVTVMEVLSGDFRHAVYINVHANENVRRKVTEAFPTLSQPPQRLIL